MTELTPRDNERSGKAPLEIERKFRVDTTKLDELGPLENYEHTSIKQGYMAIDPDGAEVRVRDKAGKYTLTGKSGGDLVRQEGEIQLSAEDFEKMWSLTGGKRVEKTRFKIPHGEYTVELDVYEGALEGLITAEIEFPDEASAREFVAPAWLGDDVTDDKRYKNQRLALRGLAEL